MKINVVGTSGSGKTTFARKMAEQLALPYIEMDLLFWKPNWTESEDGEFFPRLATALDRDGWVLDGNYTRSAPVKWRDVDMVVWLDYGFCRTLAQAVRRAWHRARSGHELWPGTGNRETLRKSFFSRDSIILWTIRTYRGNRKKYLAAMTDPRWPRIRFVRLRTPQESERFLASMRPERNPEQSTRTRR